MLVSVYARVGHLSRDWWQPADVKSVGAGVMERRIDWGPGYRVYFGRDGDRLIVLLGGGTKKRQQDIEEALTRWTDYKRRK